MKGISVSSFGCVKQLVLKSSLSVPKVNDNQVLIKIISSGINPVDTYIRSGSYTVLPNLPYTPGRDGAGIIHEVGKLVTKFKTGDKVFCYQNGRHGTLAEFSLVDENCVFELDENLSFDEGAAVAVAYFTAYRALCILARAKKGDAVLIHGASGSVGLAAVQIAKAKSMKVIGTAGTDLGMELVAKNGANGIYNHRKSDYVSELTSMHGQFDVILEMLANVNLQTDMTLMKNRGRIVVVGCRGDINISPRLLMKPETSIIGCAVTSSTPEEWQETSQEIINGMKQGWVKPVVAKVYPLEDVSQAHHDVIENQGTLGKLVVRIQEN